MKIEGIQGISAPDGWIPTPPCFLGLRGQGKKRNKKHPKIYLLWNSVHDKVKHEVCSSCTLLYTSSTGFSNLLNWSPWSLKCVQPLNSGPSEYGNTKPSSVAEKMFMN